MGYITVYYYRQQIQDSDWAMRIHESESRHRSWYSHPCKILHKHSPLFHDGRWWGFLLGCWEDPLINHPMSSPEKGQYQKQASNTRNWRINSWVEQNTIILLKKWTWMSCQKFTKEAKQTTPCASPDAQVFFGGFSKLELQQSSKSAECRSNNTTNHSQPMAVYDSLREHASRKTKAETQTLRLNQWTQMWEMTHSIIADHWGRVAVSFGISNIPNR